jgi:DNA polymerase epsilon subunit 1
MSFVQSTHCRYDEGPARVGWMFNMLPTSLPDADGREKSGLDMYFLEEDGGKFKVYTYHYIYIHN